MVAILLREPDAESYTKAMDDAPLRLLSAVTRVELSFVIEGRKGEKVSARDKSVRPGMPEVRARNRPFPERRPNRGRRGAPAAANLNG